MRPRILFLLNENIRRIFNDPGPWLTGHRIEVKDLPMDFPGDNRFVAINSLTGVVFGPFVQTKSQYYDPEGIIFTRKEPGTRETFAVKCHYLMAFDKIGDCQITHGLSWRLATELIGLSEGFSQKFREIQLTDDQFDLLCEELVRLNDNEDLQEAIGQNLWADEDSWGDETDGFAFMRDTFFGGDEALTEEFFESWDPE